MSSKFIRTKLPTDGAIPIGDFDSLVIHTVTSLLDNWRTSRSELQESWIECWATYFGTMRSQQWLRSMYLNSTMGDIGKDWRHKITQAKGYDLIETAIPYFMSASFPNQDWFDLVPCVPIPDEEGGDTRLFIRAIKEYIKIKLEEAKFKTVWNTFLRQLCIVGTSCIAMPWRVETKESKANVLVRGYEFGEDSIEEREVTRLIKNSPDMMVIDMLDIFLDPDADDPNTSDLIHRFTLRRGEIVRLINDDVYPKATLADVNGIKAARRGRDYTRTDVDSFYGVETSQTSPNDIIEVYEFWGSLELPDQELYDVIVTWSENVLLRVETNPYIGGRPFVFGQYTPIPKSPYGFGMLTPVLGNLHELDIIANCRLDGQEITLQPTFLVRSDGTVDPSDIYVEPGRAIPVSDVDGIRPLTVDNQFSAISVQEEQLREQLIERRTGTAQFVGTSPGRSGERVTAAEVEATQSAGGNRLSGVYENIERQGLLSVVQKFYDYAQQFQTYDEIIPLFGDNGEDLMHVSVGMEELVYPMRVYPIGAKHIADKEYNLRQLTDWIAVVNNTPQIGEFVNWEAVAYEVTRQFISNNPERFIIRKEQQQQPQQAPISPAVSEAQMVGGQELANGVQAEILADGGQNLLSGINQTLPKKPVYMSDEELLANGNV